MPSYVLEQPPNIFQQIDDGIHEVAASEAMTKKGPKKTNHLPWMAPEVENRLRSEVTSEFAQEATDVTRLGQPSSEFQKFFTTDAPDAVDDTKVCSVYHLEHNLC